MDIQHILQGGSSGNPIVWIRDLGDDTQDQVDTQRVPPKGVPLPNEDENET